MAWAGGWALALQWGLGTRGRVVLTLLLPPASALQAGTIPAGITTPEAPCPRQSTPCSRHLPLTERQDVKCVFQDHGNSFHS